MWTISHTSCSLPYIINSRVSTIYTKQREGNNKKKNHHLKTSCINACTCTSILLFRTTENWFYRNQNFLLICTCTHCVLNANKRCEAVIGSCTYKLFFFYIHYMVKILSLKGLDSRTNNGIEIFLVICFPHIVS